MNRPKESRVTAISSSFYKNVFLLMKMVPASRQFQHHFREVWDNGRNAVLVKNMFDKPNTAGFLHASHYLSVVYDAKLFKKMVKWPVACKKDEATYRAEIKNFFTVLSRDNSDVKFPSILMSHLILASGTIFLTFMWKLSQVALRAYIKRESQEELLDAPHTGPMNDLTITYFKKVNTEMCRIRANTHEETKRILAAADNSIKDELETLNEYKLEIVERTRIIKELVPNLPVHPSVQERLMDVEDSSIIEMWKTGMSKELQYINKKNEELKKFEESCNDLCKIVLRIKSKSGILDINQFPKLDCDNHLLRIQFDAQDGRLAFSAFFSLLHLTMQMLYHTNYNFLDLSPYVSYMQNSREIMESLRIQFGALNMRINSILIDEQSMNKSFCQKIGDVCIDFNIDNLAATNQKIALQSLKINFNFNQRTDDDLFHERLFSPPREGKYKHLFQRYKRRYCPYELPTILLDCTNSWSNINGLLSSRASSTKNERICSGQSLSPLYSRLLRNPRLKHSKENVCSLNVNCEAVNLTPKKRHSPSEYLRVKNRDGKTKKHLFNCVLSSSPLASSDAKN